jgi:uncharacterized membrane protein (UPF0127 family)
MLYKNSVSKKNLLVSKIKLCDNIWSQGTGLMFKSEKAISDTAWIFVFDKPRIIAITMMFVSFPIDLIFLDAEKHVVELKENIRPWAFYTPKNKAVSCVELLAGTIRSNNIKLNDKLIIA